MSGTAKNHEGWREKVRRYVRAGDRGEEPVFVGRESLFRKVTDMGAAASEGQTDSRTIIVAGAPGAGKTAFMRELKKRWNENRRGLAVSLRPGGLTPATLFEKIAEAVDEPVRPGDMERVLRSDEVPWSLIKERFGEHLNADSPLLLLCDEAQNMDDESKPLRTFLDSLHGGDDGASPIPLVPVLAGLSDTTLEDRPMRRLASHRRERRVDGQAVGQGSGGVRAQDARASRRRCHAERTRCVGEMVCRRLPRLAAAPAHADDGRGEGHARVGHIASAGFGRASDRRCRE